MYKIKRIFNSFIFSFIAVGLLSLGFFIPNEKSISSFAEPPTYTQITNSPPQYLEVSSEGTSGSVQDSIFFMQGSSTGSMVTLSIANSTIANTSSELNELNYAYLPNEDNASEYYYFTFPNSLSLYYNLTNQQIQAGMSGDNLINADYISSFSSEHELAFADPSLHITPQRFEINFLLDSLGAFGINGNEVTLNEEGIYTLAINLSYYYTDNGGVSYTPGTQTIYYTFMVFNSDTYFDTSGYPNITPSQNIQQTILTSSDTFSKYYYYNYSYAGGAFSAVNSLPTISYNPNLYQITISYTDINSRTFTTTLVYENGQLLQLDENGVELDEEDYFVYPVLRESEVLIGFLDTGYYDLSFQYLYKSTIDGVIYTYELPLNDSLSSSFLQNESQRLYIYGFQVTYSDYDNINPQTNQPEAVEFKTFDFENLTFENSADITSAVNGYVQQVQSNDNVEDDIDAPSGSNTGENIINYLNMPSPSSPRRFDKTQLENATLAYINGIGTGTRVQAVSTNQDPIRFLSNVTYSRDNSFIYQVTTNDEQDYILTELSSFEGFNQESAGTYVYILQYTYDYYMSTTGTLQSSYYHYQIFFFEITSMTPSVTVYDSDFNEIYTSDSGYTNKSVYILNDAQNNIFDANVTITLTARDYTTGNYFFYDEDITNLSRYGIVYGQFEEATEESENYLAYNEKIAGKWGVFIDSSSPYANAWYTISIYSNDSDRPSTRTFTIDTSTISGITARGVTFSSGSTYRIGNSLTSYSTNQPLIFSWNEKQSGARTYGYLKYIPMTSINYYSSQTEQANLSQLLDYWIQTGTLPVSYRINLNSSSSWTSYSNTYSYNNTIESSYVRSNAGFYILEVYDQAGNSSFELFLIDNTRPIFVLRTLFNDESRQILNNNQSISVPETGTRMWIEWADNKGIYIDYDLTAINNILPFSNTEGYEDARANLSSLLGQFFNTSNDDILRVTNISIPTINTSTEEGQIVTGISQYNGYYLVIDIDEVSYIRDTTSSYYSSYVGNNYEIIFIDENDQAIEGSYRIAIRDASNTLTTGNEQYDFVNNPSALLSFNVTSDDSRLTVYKGSGEEELEMLTYASYDLSGNLYSYEEDGQNIYTHLPSLDGQELTQSELTYRFSYYTPINAEDITITFIPNSENGSILQYVSLTYYPYVANYQLINGNYYWYYTLSENGQQRMLYSNDSNISYESGVVASLTFSLENDTVLGAGRYVIERQYVEGNLTSQYDYFRRTISFDIDNFQLISPLEPIQNENGNSSLESLVGGDIILSMYSGEGNSSIHVSYPSINDETGLNNGSFYNKLSYASEEEIPTFSVVGNKLPMTLYVPKYKYTTNSSYNQINNSYGVNFNDKLSYYGNITYGLESDSLWHVYSEGIEISEPFLNEQDALNFIYQTASITEYEITAKIVAEVVENGRTVTKYYITNGTDNNGYLNFYECSSNGTIIDSTLPTSAFYLQGSYIVTLYQSYNDPQNPIYSFYKFGFSIISQEPEFEIINSSGYELNETSAYTYYTNSSTLTIQWEVPTSDYVARINESFDNIIISSPLPVTHSEIVANGYTRYFTIDCSSLINSTNSYLSITMEFEGHNDNYYRRTQKTIYFDRSAPLANLQYLMTNTEYATGLFTRNYQEINMRSYQDYNGADQVITGASYSQIQNMSYSFSANSGYFDYYSYNVTTDFFNTTLVNTLRNASNYRYDTQYIYYEEIPSLDSYIQVDQNSFSASNYYQLTTNGASGLRCGYYEVVEMDYAGNMVVYIVYVIDSQYQGDENISNEALVYSNSQHPEDNVVLSSDITEGFNIYSNSGFELSKLNYMSDPWSVVFIQLAGQSQQRYMTSPWLEEGYVYRISISSSGISFQQVSLASIFANVESSNSKHTLVFTDRVNGLSYNTYLSIMDASLTTQKVEDPEQSSAILNISVPTAEQYQSTTSSYIFPTRISIYQYNPNAQQGDGYELIMDAEQLVYGTWSPISAEFEGALSYISFTTINSGSTLQVVINLGNNSSQKVRFEILDNFGNTTTIIQLANEVAYDEISGDSDIYQITESSGDVTYLSDQTIRFSYNILLYSVTIYDREGQTITNSFVPTNLGNNIYAYSFVPTEGNTWDDYYRVLVTDSENNQEIRTLHIRLYYQLPYLAHSTGEIDSGGIVFLDRSFQPLQRNDFAVVNNFTVNFNGTPYTATAYSATTYSSTIRIRFRDGQDLNVTGSYGYLDSYGYSVYLSSDNGLSWQNINSENSDISGYTISGAGEYLILVKYDSDEVFTNLCCIYSITILDSSTSYYFITVDGLPIERSNMKYIDDNGYEYDVNYIVSVDYDDKLNRLHIEPNVELDVIISDPIVETTGTNVIVEIYHYECEESRGDFTIIYISQTDNILTQLTYQTPTGTTQSIRSDPSVVIVANNETESSFDRLRINFNTYYGIEQNVINVEVIKYFNGAYVNITPTIYNNEDMSYLYLEQAGSYRLRIYDSCSPANVHLFENSQYISIVFLNSVPFTVTYQDTVTGEEVISERIDNAAYNSDVTLSLYNLSTYYQASGYPSISVTLNGRNYTGFTSSSYSYTFSSPGYYSVLFTATSTTGVPIRQAEYNFTIINKNESRYAYEFVPYKNYYIESVVKDGVDILQDLIDIGNFSTVVVDGETYLSELRINYLDEKTGTGRYQITINTNDNTFANSQSYTFEFWLNMQTPPLNISIAEGDSTTSPITITFNVQNFYNAMGDSYIRIGSQYHYFTADRLENYGETYTITIDNTGTYFVQVYTMSNNLLYSYKVTKAEPLNAFAIIAIVVGVIAAAAVVGITIALRKRQKVK